MTGQRPSLSITKETQAYPVVQRASIRFFRRIIPPLRLGNFSIDLGFMVLLFVVYVLMQVVQSAAA